ncbi:helix-turn-helix domain-containing protein [Streptomyces inhibens]|uniref:helix-turn-helix domain-containing protein n=1 Tax=Streptomyces inhibens TaxID=2293571 RepID=UPI001FD33DE5|nr:helix-turn-helix domain-containing protein [Streptomyces inhibens]
MRGHRHRRKPRPLLAASPRRLPVHHPTRTCHPPCRLGRPGAPGRDTSGRPARKRRCGRPRPHRRQPRRPGALETLDAYCSTGSLRRAADLLHLHHSSVARRLEQLGKGLDIELTEPTGQVRARLGPVRWVV